MKGYEMKKRMKMAAAVMAAVMGMNDTWRMWNGQRKE